MPIPIPIIIIYGSTVDVFELGWTADSCRRCQRVQPFTCQDLVETTHVYYIETGTRDLGKVITCDFCETSYALPRGQEIRINPVWNPLQDLQILVDTTNPHLGEVSVPESRTETELAALLTSINERGSVFGKNVTRGIRYGIFIGAGGLAAIAGIAAALRLFFLARDAVGQVFVSMLLGGFAGAIVGAIVDSRQQGRNAVLNLLERSMMKHNMKIAELQTTLGRMPRRLGRVRRALRRFAAPTTQIRPAIKGKCSRCGLMNFPDHANCRRCGAAIGTQ